MKFTVVYITYSDGFIHTIQQLSIQNLLSLVFFALDEGTKLHVNKENRQAVIKLKKRSEPMGLTTSKD